MAKPVASTYSQHPPIPCDRIPDHQQYINNINRVFQNKTLREMTGSQQESYIALLVFGLRDIQQSRMICSNPEYYSNMIRKSAASKN